MTVTEDYYRKCRAVIRRELIAAEKRAHEELKPSPEWQQTEYWKALMAELTLSLQIQIDPDIE